MQRTNATTNACYNEYNERMLQRTMLQRTNATANDPKTNDATTNKCYNEQFLSIKSECYNEQACYNECGGILTADATHVCT